MTRTLFRRHRFGQPLRSYTAAAVEHAHEPAPVSHPLRCGKLHGLEAGSLEGPLVILLHGFPDFSWGWRKQVPALVEQGYRVVVPDQRGYAQSDKPLEVAAYRLDLLVGDILALADACGGDRFRLIGHDWGGIVAWSLAARHPHRVKQLVIINAPHPDAWSRLVRRRWSQACKSWYVAFFQLPWLPELLLRARRFSLLRSTLRRSSHTNTFTAGTLEHYLGVWAQPGALTAMINYYRALRLRRSGTPRIQTPTLVLWGEEDRFLNRELADASLRLCENGGAIYFPQAGHWLHLEEPELVNEAMLHFFSGALETSGEPLEAALEEVEAPGGAIQARAPGAN